MEFLKDDGVIERLSEKLFELQYTESTLLPKLQEQLKQKEIENIVTAVQKGFGGGQLVPHGVLAGPKNICLNVPTAGKVNQRKATAATGGNL